MLCKPRTPGSSEAVKKFRVLGAEINSKSMKNSQKEPSSAHQSRSVSRRHRITVGSLHSVLQEGAPSAGGAHGDPQVL